MSGIKRERAHSHDDDDDGDHSHGDGGVPVSSIVCKCKNSRCLKMYCECFRANAYCGDCLCKNCQNKPEHEDKRRAAIERIQERNGVAFNKGRKPCNCKRSMCLKKYCECFQAGMPCLPECKCHSCKNFEGSELRNRVMAGDDVDSVKKRATSKLSTSFNADDDLDDPPARVPPVAAEERRSRRSSVVAASALAAAAATADNDPFRHDPYGSTTVQRPSAMPIRIRLPHASTRSFRNQLVRLDLSSFIGTSLPSFTHLLLVGVDEQQRAAAATAKDSHVKVEEAGAAPSSVANANSAVPEPMDLRTGETLNTDLMSLQERLVLEETANYLKKVLEAAKSAVESAAIVGGAHKVI